MRAFTLDQLLAFDHASFDYERNRESIDRAIGDFSRDPSIRGTSIETDVVPAAEALRSWLRFFESSMRDWDKRLVGCTRLRVCYAERGMTLTVALARAANRERTAIEAQFLRGRRRATGAPQGDDEERRKAQAAIAATTEMLRAVLGPYEGGIFLMRTWLSALVDLVPADLRSHDTSLTRENLALL